MSDEYNPNHIHKPVYVELGVKSIVIAPDGRILLLKRSDKVTDPHTWGFPGGGVDKDEDPRIAAMREVVEEASINVTDPKPFATYVYDGKGVVIIGYIVRATSTDIRLNWESEDFKWLTREELALFDLPDLHDHLRKKFLDIG